MPVDDVTEAAVAKLADAKKNMSWIRTARIFREGQQQDPQHRSDFERRAAAVSGFSLGILKRFVTVLNFVESPAIKGKVAEKAIEASFTKLELIERLYRKAPVRASEWLGKLGERGVRVAAIKRDLDDAHRVAAAAPTPDARLAVAVAQHLRPDPAPPRGHRSYSASARGMRGDLMMNSVSDMLRMLSGRVELFHTPSGTNKTPVRCDAVAWLDPGYRHADGFEFLYAPAQTTHAQFADQLARSVLASTFFRRYWMIYSDDSRPEFADRAVFGLGLLEASTVGVAFLGSEMKKRILRMPEDKAPVPDRRHLLASVCPGGRWI